MPAKIKINKSNKTKINKIKNMERPKIMVNERGFPEPLIANCFRCCQDFPIKYNPAIGMYTQKNYWLYWVSEEWNPKKMSRKPENERGDKLCNNCLKSFYLEEKKEFLNQARDKRKRQTLRSYLYHSVI
jgi:hypothetical protein